MTDCHKLIYSSSAVELLSQDQLEELMIQARIKNRNHQVTGCLVYHQGKFIQYLEGPQHEVKSIYSSIVNDSRHEKIVLLCSDATQERVFKDWSMALKYIPADKINDYQTVYDIFEDMMDVSMINRLCDRAVQLLEGYLYRASLSNS